MEPPSLSTASLNRTLERGLIGRRTMLCRVPFCDFGGFPGGKSGSHCWWVLVFPGEGRGDRVGVVPSSVVLTFSKSPIRMTEWRDSSGQTCQGRRSSYILLNRPLRNGRKEAILDSVTWTLVILMKHVQNRFIGYVCHICEFELLSPMRRSQSVRIQ